MDNTKNIICIMYLSNFNIIAFKTLIAGWNELECHRVFIFLCDLTHLPRKIEIVVNGKPGVNMFSKCLQLHRNNVVLIVRLNSTFHGNVILPITGARNAKLLNGGEM